MITITPPVRSPLFSIPTITQILLNVLVFSDDWDTTTSNPNLLASREHGPLLPDLDREELISPRSPDVTVLFVRDGEIGLST